MITGTHVLQGTELKVLLQLREYPVTVYNVKNKGRKLAILRPSICCSNCCSKRRRQSDMAGRVFSVGKDESEVKLGH